MKRPRSQDDRYRPTLVARARWTATLASQVRDQPRFPFRPGHEIEQAQRRRLSRTVAHAYRTVPYYRETMRRLGLDPNDIRTADDLTRLPTIERAQIQRDPEYFVSNAQPISRYLKVHSGGSSGQPVTIFHDAASIVASGAHVERQRPVVRRLAGRRLHLREAIVESPFGTTQGVNTFLRDHLLVSSRWVVDRLYLSLLDPIEHNIAALRAFDPDVVEGYGSYLELLFPRLLADGPSPAWPRVAVYGSDAMSDATRALISRDMGIPVTSAYGAIEALHLGFECELGRGYHLNSDLAAPRIVGPDGAACPPTESGELLISNLVNRASVLLNYRVGDLVTELPGPCPCGRALPLIDFLDGRTDDTLDGVDGTVLHPQTVRTLFTDQSDVIQYQIHQAAPGRFQLALVTREGADRTELTQRITDRFVARLGPETETTIAFVDDVPRTAAGKVKVVTRSPGGSLR